MMLESEEEQLVQDEHSTIPTLPLFSGHSLLPLSPKHLFMATPPICTTSASIPFTWEEKPGKRRLPSTPPRITHLPHASNMLEPPPGGRVSICYFQNTAKTTSPDTVLDGPYNLLNSSSSEFNSSSFRLFMNEEGIDSGKKKLKTKRLMSLLPSWKLRTTKNGKKDIVGASSRSFVFPSARLDETTSDKSLNIARISRTRSLHSLSPKPQLWASLYQGLKYVIPWKTSRKSRKYDLV